MKKTIAEILFEIQKAQSILLHCHPHADPDSVGGTNAMKLVLERFGKKVTHIQGDSPISSNFAFPGVETIISKNIFEIDLTTFDLFLILDSGSIEMVSARGAVVFPSQLMTIIIDHHASNKGYGKINLIEPTYSSTCELLFDIFKHMNVELNHDIAINLIMGMYTDTGGFRYGLGVTKTLTTTAYLATFAPDFQEVISIMENSNRKGTLIFEKLALSSLSFFAADKIAAVAISHEELEKNNITEEDCFAGGISNKLKSVKGVMLAVTIIELEPYYVKVSFRTRDVSVCDVLRLATALGGGGHKAAAGVKMNLNAKDALEKVVKTARELYTI